ncbi:hypothetical protein [Salinigranum sp. GCM10025319]|uniref:hypothetical protein n=1 Tax=Salinigranum sp. GCM10025319 TaxID=3252687 RepID=UPI00360E6887
MPSSRRSFLRLATGTVLVGAGCNGRSPTEGLTNDTDQSAAPNPRTDSTPSTDGRSATATDEDEASSTTPGVSFVLHDVDPEDAPGARVGVVSPDVWRWLTEAAETGAVDIATEEGWSPTFPVASETPTPTPEDGMAPRVALAVAEADVLVVDGDPYTVRTTYGGGEAGYQLKTEPVGSVDEADPPDETDSVAEVSALPPDQRRIARAAIENESGYSVGFHETASEAFEGVREYDYLRHEDETYWTFTVHGDKFRRHTTLWLSPVEGVGEADVVLEVESVELSTRGQELFAAAVVDGAEQVASAEAVPAMLADAVEAYDLLATATGLYRARITG